MSASVIGTISYVATSFQHTDRGAIVGSQVRIVIRQPTARAPHVECVIDTGPGTQGYDRAESIKRRLRVGTACHAFGRWLGCAGDSRTLQLHDAAWVRGGEVSPQALEAVA